jgi:Sulfotransferase domain
VTETVDSANVAGAEVHYPPRSREPISDLYRRNMRCVGRYDVVLASYGGAGGSIISNALQELGLNYVDAYSEILLPDGSSAPVSAEDDFRRRFRGLHRRDADAGAHRPRRGPWPRFVKTHLPPAVFGTGPLGGAWIHVRDPRDALFSWHAWRRGFGVEPWDLAHGGIEDFLGRADYTGRTPVEDWCAFYHQWSRRALELPASATTRFEDLKQAPFEVMRRGLRDLGLEIADDEVRRAVEQSTFEVMRTHEDRVVGSGDDGPAQPRMMRRGQPGEWREWMTPELAGHFSWPGVRTVAGHFGYRLAETR